MKKEAALLYLGNSNIKTFPLILFLGREFNSDKKVDPSVIGEYDFKDSPHSIFWNRSYGLISRITKRRNFKRECIAMGISPIIFSNISPKPILNKLKKEKIREELKPEKLDPYLDELFKSEIVKKRVKIIVLPEEVIFKGAIEKIENNARKEKIKTIIKLPYLGSRISNDLLDKRVIHQDEINKIVNEFYENQS